LQVFWNQFAVLIPPAMIYDDLLPMWRVWILVVLLWMVLVTSVESPWNSLEQAVKD
jgi:hypothetical protein